MRITPLALASLAVLSLAACTPTTPVVPDESADHDHPSLMLSWDVVAGEEDDTGMTMSDVSLVLSGPMGDERGRLDLGSYAGCGVQEVPGDGPMLTLKCWWAGGGDDFQVRMEGTNTLVVDHRAVDEEAEIPEFTPLKSMTAPEGMMIAPVAA